jgi:hypothetical protein
VHEVDLSIAVDVGEIETVASTSVRATDAAAPPLRITYKVELSLVVADWATNKIFPASVGAGLLESGSGYVGA